MTQNTESPSSPGSDDIMQNIENIKANFTKEKSPRGLFATALIEKIKKSNDDEEKELLLLALNYGLDSFSDKGVKKLW